MYNLLTTIIELFRPLSLDAAMKSARQQRAVSQQRRNMATIENHVRRIQSKQVQPVTSTDWYWSQLTREQMLFELLRKYQYLELWEDVTRLSDERHYLQHSKRRKGGRPAAARKTDKDGWTEINPKDAKHHTHGVELSELEIELLTGRGLSDLDKARAIKAEWIKGHSKQVISTNLTKALGKGYSETSIRPYMAVFNEAKETISPTPTTFEWSAK